MTAGQIAPEDGAVKEQQPPTAVSFLDPALKGVWRRVLFLWSRTLLILCVFILCVLSLFWAVQFHVEGNLSSLRVWVIDFDGKVDPYRTNDTIVGPAVTDAASQIIHSTTEHVGYTIVSPAEFNYDVLNVRQQIYDEHAYAAIIVNANATSLLRGAVANANSTYVPTGAIQSVIISARDETTYFNYIMPALSQFETAVQAVFGPRWIQSLVQESRNISHVPQAVNPGIGFNILDLRPFTPAVVTPAVTVGLIYLIIVAYFNFPFLMPIHTQLVKGNQPPLKTWQWLTWRVISHIFSYFFLSLFYSLVSLEFLIPFSNSPAPDTVSATNANAYGHGSFVVFWMLNWVGMAALGFPCENMAMVLGTPWSSLFLIFWVISNVETAFYPLDLAPQFFYWGYAWPLHRIVGALRTIIFGTHSRIGLDFGVLFAWVVGSLVLYPFANFIMQWKIKRGL